MKNKFLIPAVIITLLITANTAFALPTISSADDQTFEKHQGTQQLRDITITEDAETPLITAGEIKITIPAGIAMIFDAKRTAQDILIHGTAVDSGKVLENPAVTFENGDKTLVIPVEEDFATGEQIVVTRTFVEGFTSTSSQSDSLTMQIGDAQYTDDRHLYIQVSSNDDTHEPEMPTDVQVQDDDAGVKITWTDPTDLDLQTVHILRGKGTSPVSGEIYTEVAAGVQEYVDTDVETDETVKYILRASDGRNVSDNTEEIEFVVGSTPEEEVVEEEPAEEPADSSEELAEEPADSSEEPAEEPSPELIYFTDTTEHWAEDKIAVLAGRNIVFGHPDGTFRPEDNLNRAEASTLLYRVIGLEEPFETVTQSPFSDVPITEWYVEAISYFKIMQVIQGYADDTFRPAENITRAEFLKLAIGVFYILGDDEVKVSVETLAAGDPTNVYADLGDEWHVPVVTVATAYDFVQGRECGDAMCFEGNAPITRAEATEILYNMFYY